jgi:hypothetical protein
MTRTYLLAFALLAACSDAQPVTVTMSITEAAPAYGTTPFPTDALREGDHLGVIAGLDTIVVHHTDAVAAHLAALDGFGVRPLVEFFVDGDLVPEAITADAVGLVDVDPASPERGRAFDLEWHYDADRRVLAAALATGVPLREGTRYAAFVTTAIGAAHLASLAGAPARWQSTADAVAELGRGDLAGITVFTTEHASAPLLAARTVLATAPAPELAFDNPAIIFTGTTALDRVIGRATRATDGSRAGLEHWGNDNPTGIAHDHVGVVGTGTITIVRFRGDDTHTDGPEDETFELDAAGVPMIRAIERIPITFILPAAPPPAAGYPVVIYGHGLGAGRDQLLSFAEPLTSQGFALVGIDMVGHGSRYNPADEVANMSGQLPQFTGEAATPDGFGDRTGLGTTFDFFEGFVGISAVRDSIRQSALDLCRVSQLVHRADLDLSALAGPGGVPKLDTSHVAYMGESFGTVVGTVFAAIEPAIDLYVLDVPGGGILDKILPESPEIGALALPFIETIYNPKATLDRWNPLIGMMQAVIDGADPLTYAPHILRDRFAVAGTTLGPRSVIALEVVGDQVLANAGTIALAQGLGLDVLAPHLDAPPGLATVAAPAAGNRDGQTAVLVQYAPATHGANWSSEHGTLRYDPVPDPGADVPYHLLATPITIANPIYETLDQVTEILVTHQAGEAPRVKMTKAPVLDFDGDGRPDAQDPAPLDPTR